MIGAAKAEKAESLRRAFFDEPPPTDTEASTGLSKADVIMRAEVDLPGRVESVSLTVKKGEILGIAGLVGSGRTSLLRALAGLEPQARGSLTIGSVTGKLPRSPRAALRRGVALIPEDRMTQGLALNMRAAENMLLGDLGQVASYGMISERKLLQRAVELAAEVGFAPGRVKETARWLSGGNQQKLLVGRWRHAPPSVLLADEPTRGVDIGAKAEILSTLTDFAAEGRGVILVSSELEEVLAVSHRVLVLRDGEVVTSIDRGPALTVHAVLDAVFRVDAGQVAAD